MRPESRAIRLHNIDDHPATDDHASMLRRWIWRDFVNITLGVWLIASPATFGYRSTAMAWSDWVSGAWLMAARGRWEPQAPRPAAIILLARWW